ncbi:hypothetical protein K7432_018325, partial [Basidiobolus ranarum]
AEHDFRFLRAPVKTKQPFGHEAKEVLKEKEASKPKGKAKEPGSLGSTVPLIKFFTPLQRSVFPESEIPADILAKRLNFTMEPGTPAGRMLILEVYPTPGT